MWVLSTDRAELHEFPSPEAVIEGYAILSHVWDDKEQSFQVTQSLIKLCAETGGNPRDTSYRKIQLACRVAQSHGYKWLWVDTSCIDKSSSADLSEAINSMYRYYSLAKICYAYLGDVLPGRFASERSSEFRQSKWHTRGWTLQELIAPTFVLFLACDWSPIGTKAELAALLEAITQVPAGLLRLETRLADYSVAQRMSWAAFRKTTRQEDRAYSLLGIFGINMSTLYGEGEHAFYRLQEEIMRRRSDTSLFAWSSEPSSRPDLPELPLTKDKDKYLLAPSPDYFRSCGSVSFRPPRQEMGVVVPTPDSAMNNEYSGTITFSVTPYGIRAYIPLIEHWYKDSGRDEVTAYLFWYNLHNNRPIGLRLKPSPGPASAGTSRQHYEVVDGRLYYDLSQDEHGRLMDRDSSHTDSRQIIRLTWQEIYITHRPPLEPVVSEHATKVFVAMNLGSLVPFRISDTDVDALPTSPLPMELTDCTPIPLPWDGNPPAVLQFESRSSLRYYATLRLGLCWRRETKTFRAWTHWAVFQVSTRKYIPGHWALQHDCDSDHIDQWLDQTKIFEAPRSNLQVGGPGESVEDTIILHFDTCPMNPGFTLITRIMTSRTGGGAASNSVSSTPLLSRKTGMRLLDRTFFNSREGMLEKSVQTDRTQLGGEDSVTHPQVMTQSHRSSLDSTTPPHSMDHSTLSSEAELESQEYHTAEGSAENNDERLLDSNVDGSNDRRCLSQDASITTTPEELQHAVLDSQVWQEEEEIQDKLPPMNTETEGRGLGIVREEESGSPGGRDQEGAEKGDEACGQGSIPEGEVGFDGEASAPAGVPLSRQVTLPPKVRKALTFFKFWKKT